MNFPARAYFLVFGIVTILGGVWGFVVAHSLASIIAGGISGSLLIVGARLLGTRANMAGIALALLVSLALAGKFIPALMFGYLYPGVYMAPLSVVGICVAALQLFKPEK